MKSQHLGLYVLAAAVLVVGALASGVPASSLWTVALGDSMPAEDDLHDAGMHGGGNDDSGALEGRRA